MNLKHILLLGHRQQHGKDTCCDILENLLNKSNIKYTRTFFAELLKKQVAERYNLDAAKMELAEYKKWCPPWINPIQKETNKINVKEWKDNNALIDDQWCEVVTKDAGYSGNVVVYLKPRTVRDILIEEGCNARAIWGDAWANYAYQKLFNSGSRIGIISDYRFPNEYSCFQNSLIKYLDSRNETPNYNFEQPKIHRVLVHRPAGVFKNDGADGELPDLEDTNAWDYVIMNDIEGQGWKERLEIQMKEILVNLNLF